MVTLLLLFIFVICAAMVWMQGFWNATLTMICTVFAALLATNYFEPAAAMLDVAVPSFTFFFDFIALWLIFVVFYTILRLLCGLLSRHQMRFIKPVEIAGRSLMAVWVAWLMVCFTNMTLHTAPIPSNGFARSFQSTPISGDFAGIAADRAWLGFMQSRTGEWGALSKAKVQEFDAKSEFIFKYHTRRAMLERQFNKTGSLRVSR